MTLKKIFLATVLLLVIIGAIITFLLLFQESTKRITQPSKQELTECLDDNKSVSYKSEDREDVLADLTIFINDKLTSKEIFSFKIDNVYRTVPRAELHKCGLYVIRFLNYDPKKTKQNPDFKVEIWKYRYDGRGEPFFSLSEGNYLYYAYVFRIDPYEKYLVLEKGYLGKDDYALVIKDLITKEDIFVLSAKEIFEQHPSIIGVFDMREWSKDSKYFWGSISDGAYVKAYFKIDTQNWKTDIFETPDGAMGGFPLNINTGYVPIQPGQVWTGDYQLTQELKEQYRKEGRKSQLYLYNLFTKEKILIEITDEPLYSFKPRWLSDTELEYELPTGEKKIYKINE